MIAVDKIKEALGDKIINWYEHNPRRIYFGIDPAYIKEVARFMFSDMHMRLITCTGQDTPEALEILYNFSLDKTGEIFSVRVKIPDKKNPEIDSIANLFPGAEWIEREIWELLGINFKGHPDLKRLLLSEEWPEGKYPLRKEGRR
jgi:NADH:ubiquinone oxidoreductase subunit C